MYASYSLVMHSPHLLFIHSSYKVLYFCTLYCFDHIHFNVNKVYYIFLKRASWYKGHNRRPEGSIGLQGDQGLEGPPGLKGNFGIQGSFGKCSQQTSHWNTKH